ncbi:MAG: hypothetical protein MZV65_01705 [Chromatiales bacterium]|nr:hypothetical protein [Chromatiales bacterium]
MSITPQEALQRTIEHRRNLLRRDALADAPDHERRDLAGDDRRHPHRPARSRRKPSARSPPPPR